MHDWDFTSYALSFLLHRCLSEEFAAHVSGKLGIRYEEEDADAGWLGTMRDELIGEKGYFIGPGDLFVRLKRRVDDGGAGDVVEAVRAAFGRMEASAQGGKFGRHLAGLFELMDLSDAGAEGRIRRAMEGVSRLDCGGEGSHNFGDACEHFIDLYAIDAGVAGGHFHTPPDVANLLVSMVGSKDPQVRRVYDPACGCGSLLLAFGRRSGLRFYGQERQFAAHCLCRINMLLHGVGCGDFEVATGDVLVDDGFPDEKFDAVVSNPPCGRGWMGSMVTDMLEDPRFSGPGVLAPDEKADFAFVLHSLYHLAEHGVAAIVCYPGMLHRERAEKEIRRYLVENNYVDAIIKLPENMLWGTNLDACVMVLRKNRRTTDVFFMDASAQYKREGWFS